jgi:hypothetical protein
MINITQITGAEAVDDTRYHVFTDKGIFLLDINLAYTLHGVDIPAFATVQNAIEHFNN